MFGFWIEGSGLGFRVISLLGYERPAKADSCIRIRVCFPDLAMDVREAKLTSCLGFAQRSPRTLGEASVGWLIDRGALYMVQGDNGFQRKPGAKRVECLSISLCLIHVRSMTSVWMRIVRLVKKYSPQSRSKLS